MRFVGIFSFYYFCHFNFLLLIILCSFQEVQQSNVELLRRLSEVELKVVQSNDQILKRIADLEIKIQSNPMEDRLKDVEERMKTNEELMERLQNLERKVDKMLAVNEEPMKVF